MIENARIASAEIGIEGHGLLTATLQLEGPNWSQGFGGRNYGSQDSVSADQGQGLALFVLGVLRVCGVGSWEKVRGQYVRVERDGKVSRIVRVGNILRDEWLNA